MNMNRLAEKVCGNRSDDGVEALHLKGELDKILLDLHPSEKTPRVLKPLDK